MYLHTQHAVIRTFLFSLCFGESTFKVGNVVCLSEKDYPHIVACMGKPVKLTGGCFYHMCWLLFHSQSSPGIHLLDSGREALTTLTYLQSARIRWIQITRQVLPGHHSVGWPEKVQGTGLACHDGLRAESLNSWASSPLEPQNPRPPCSENLEPHCPFSENAESDRGCCHLTQSAAPSASSFVNITPKP